MHKQLNLDLFISNRDQQNRFVTGVIDMDIISLCGGLARRQILAPARMQIMMHPCSLKDAPMMMLTYSMVLMVLSGMLCAGSQMHFICLAFMKQPAVDSRDRHINTKGARHLWLACYLANGLRAQLSSKQKPVSLNWQLQPHFDQLPVQVPLQRPSSFCVLQRAPACKSGPCSPNAAASPPPQDTQFSVSTLWL